MRRLTSLIIILTVAAVVLRGDQTVRQPAGGPIIENPVGSSEIFKCGGDQTLPNPIPIRWTTVVLAGDGRLLVACPGAGQLDHEPKLHPEHRENRENALLSRLMLERDPEVRWRGVQARVRLRGLPGEEVDPTASEKEPSAIGHFIRTSGGAFVSPACNGVTQIFGTGTYPKRWSPGWLFRLMLDANPGIQLEAAYALGVQLSQVDLEPDLMTAAIREVRACNMRPIDDSVAAALLEVVGIANYTDDDQRLEAEQLLVRETQGSVPRILGAMRGLEAFIRRDPQRIRDERTRVRLRELAVYGQKIGEPPPNDPSATIRRLAMQSLMAMGDTDNAMLDRASQDGDWQVRRLIAGRLSLATPYEIGLGQRFAADPAFQVRYEFFLSSVGRLAARTKECAPIVPFFTDPEPTVVLRAIDVLPATCTDLDDVVIEKLRKLTEVLEKPYDKSSWHLPARAFAALARLKPEETKPRLSLVAKNDRWEIRVLVAGLAVTLGDVDTVMMLVRDPNPNVRHAVLSALADEKSPLAVPLAIEALRDASDYRLLQTAALVLKGLPEEAKDDATEALLFALSRITDQADDTSREARIAMIDRLAETMRPGRTVDLQRYTFDFDDEVIHAARKSFETILGVPPPEVVPLPLWRHYPYQPTEEELRSAPATAMIQLEEGFITMRLLSDVAPVTVARFAELARMGAYNDTTFYHVAPNAIVQAGSPGSNDQSAPTKRFLRTEVGPQARHIRGAVGMWDHGNDSGDGQIFIDLVDQPHFDHQYTVFAYVTSGMELVDRLLEGAKIIGVTLK